MIDPNDTIDVLHPNGSVVTLPTSIAMAAGVTPDMIVPRAPAAQQVGTTLGPKNSDPAGPPPQPPPPPPLSPGSIAGLQNASNSAANTLPLLHLGVNGGTGVDQEVASPSGQVTTTPDTSAPAAPAAPAAAAQPAPAQPSTPTDQPVTTADLQKMGIAGIYNASSEAMKKAEDAGKVVADKEAAEQTAFANAYDDRNKQINSILKQRADDAEAKAKEIDTRIADYDGLVKKYADTKIDRGIDHPIAAAISAVLGMFGQAATGSQSNAALDLMFKQVERKTQAQLEDRNQLGQVVGMKRADIDLIRQKATDSTARYNLALAGEIEKTARQIEAVGARSQSDIVKARAQEAAAQFRQKGADALGQAVMAQQGKDERDRAFAEQLRHTKVEEKNASAQLGLGYAHLKLAKDQFDWTKDYQQQQLNLDADKLLLSGKQNQAVQVREQGIGGVPTVTKDADGNVTGYEYKPLLNKDNNQFIAATKEEAVKLRSQKAGVDIVNKFVNDMADGIKQHGGESSFFKSADWQKMMANKESLLFGLHQAYGVEGFRPGVLEQMEKALGGVDPTSFFRNATPGLRAAASAVNDHFDANLRSQGYTGEKYQPFSSGGDAPPPTPDEQSFKDVLTSARRTKNAADLAQEVGIDPAQTGGTRQMLEATDRELTKTGGMTPTQKSTIDSWGAVLKDPNAKKDVKTRAVEYLARAAEGAESPGVREYAQSQMGDPSNAVAATPSEPTDLARTSTSNDTSYGGAAQTAAAQRAAEQMRSNVLSQMPLNDIVVGASVKPTDPNYDPSYRQELVRRANVLKQPDAIKAQHALIQGVR